MIIPNLFLLGAQKGGSTSLHGYLEQHPNISSVGGVKEPNIFCGKNIQEKLGKLQDKTAATQYCIDGSVDYTRFPRFSETAENISRFTAGREIRFIYIIRDPVDRLVSNYFWNMQRYGEYRSLDEALSADSQYVNTSRYDIQIDQYLRYFNREQFLFIKFEDFVVEPLKVVNEVFDWLGLSQVDELSLPKKDAATDKVTTRVPKFSWINRLVLSSNLIKSTLNKLLPQRMLRVFANIISKNEPLTPVSESKKNEIRAKYFSESICSVEALTGLDLSDWTGQLNE